MSIALLVGAGLLTLVSIGLGAAALLRLRNDLLTAVQLRHLDQLTATVDALDRAIGRAEESRAQAAPEPRLSAPVARALRRALDVPATDAALVIVPGGDRGPELASAGLTAEQEAQYAATLGPHLAAARSVHLHFRDAEEPFASGTAVASSGEPADRVVLLVLSRAADRVLEPRHIETLERLAETVRAQLGEARLPEAQARAQTGDALTSLPGRHAFQSELTGAIARASAAGRRLALVVLDLDGFRDVNESMGQLGGDAVLAALGRLVQETLGADDAAFRIGGDEFAVILPGSGLAGGEGLFARVVAQLRSRSPADAPPLRLSAGIAELKPDEDALELLARANAALARAKEGGGGTVAAAR
jgi:diguanylate cyclase (GGDEF)-like protein